MWAEKIGAGHYHIESANRTYFVAGAKLNPLCTFRAEGDWSLIQNSLSGVLDLYYAIALMSLPSKCRMS